MIYSMLGCLLDCTLTVVSVVRQDSNANVLSMDRSNAPLPTLGGAKTAAAKSASEEQITDLLLNFTIQGGTRTPQWH